MFQLAKDNRFSEPLVFAVCHEAVLPEMKGKWVKAGVTEAVSFGGLSAMKLKTWNADFPPNDSATPTNAKVCPMDDSPPC